ncbi:MAG TPA: threonine synthase [Bacillales bacterium]
MKLVYLNSLQCVWCGHEHQPSIKYKCDQCGGSLEVTYDYDSIFQNVSLDQMLGRREDTITAFRELLPICPDMKPVSLGEGWSPLQRASELEQRLEHQQIYTKNEAVNPTLSFKDRPLAVALSVAKQFNVSGVVTASTGNTGVAAAAYSAKAGIPCHIYVPKGTPKEKLAMMEVYGAIIDEVEGNFSDAYVVAGEEAEKKQWFNLTSTFLNPYAIEGDKTLAYELYLQYDGVPDWIVIPIGAGPLLVSCFKGFKELKRAGKISKLPRMVGVQAENCAPIVRAFQESRDHVQPWDKPDTIAGGIADPLTSYPEDGTRTLMTLYESKGYAVPVSDDNIRKYQKLLAQGEGIFAEPSSVTAVAAIESMKNDGALAEGESVVSVITGHGLKDLKSLL